MNRIVVGAVSLVGVSLMALAGCQRPPMDMKPPQRPAELDELNVWVGRWESTGECRMGDSPEAIACSSSNTVTWEADRWILVERFEGKMGDEEHVCRGVGVYTWNPKTRQYESWWFDSHGGVGKGTWRYDANTKTWTAKAKSQNPVTGMSSVGEGTVKMPDNNTIEWTWTEWDSLKLNKFMEMKGTSRRK